MSKPSDDENAAAATEHLIEQFEKQGVATAKMSDGRIFLFKVDFLHDLIDTALNKGSDQVSLFIKDDVGVVN